MNDDSLERYALRLMINKEQGRARIALVAGPVLIAAGSAYLFGAAIHSLHDAGFYMLIVLCGVTLATAWVYTTTKQYARAPIMPPLRLATRDAVAMGICAYLFGGGWGGYGLAIIAATTGVLLGLWFSQHLESRA